MRVVTTAAQSGGAHFAMEITEPPGGGPPLHKHTREDELFLVLVGEFTFWVNGQILVVRAGDAAFGPRGIPHCFKNCSSAPARMLVVCTPGECEAFFDYGLPLPDGSPPPDSALLERIVTLAPRFGIELLGPSPL